MGWQETHSLRNSNDTSFSNHLRRHRRRGPRVRLPRRLGTALRQAGQHVRSRTAAARRSGRLINCHRRHPCGLKSRYKKANAICIPNQKRKHHHKIHNHHHHNQSKCSGFGDAVCRHDDGGGGNFPPLLLIIEIESVEMCVCAVSLRGAVASKRRVLFLFLSSKVEY